MTSIEEYPGAAWHIPEYIHPLFHDGGVLLFNSRSAKTRVENRSVALKILEASNLLNNMHLEWPEIHDSFPNPVSVDQVSRAGLIAPGEAPANAPTSYPYAILPEDVNLSEAGAIPALRAQPEPLALDIHLQQEVKSCLQETFRLVKQVRDESRLDIVASKLERTRDSGAVPPNMETARMLARAVFQVGYDYPEKLACRERSIGTALLGAVYGYTIEVHFGARVDPINLHAWAAVSGEPVQLDDEERVKGYYNSMYHI